MISKQFKFFFLAFCLLSMTSCINLIEELTLNKDGSGKYAITFDMSGMFSDPMMKGMIEEMVKQEGGIQQNPFSDMDTIIYFKDAPAEKKAQLSNPEFWNKAWMKMHVSEADKKMVATINLDFDKIEDVDYFYKNLDKVGGDGNIGNGFMFGSGGFLPKGALFNLSGKQLSRLPIERPGGAMEGEEMQFAKMFFAAAKYTTIYNLPGKVKKSSIPNSKVSGNKVTAEYSFLDLMEGKAKAEGDIKFK